MEDMATTKTKHFLLTVVWRRPVSASAGAAVEEGGRMPVSEGSSCRKVVFVFLALFF